MVNDVDTKPAPVTERVPRLAGDTVRTMVSLAIACPLTIGGIFAYTMVALRQDWPVRGRAYLASVELLLFVIYFAVYQVMTWAVMRRAGADQLARWVRATTPRTREERRTQFLLGSGARAWAISAAGLALIAVVVVSVVESLRTEPVIQIVSLLVVITAWTMIVYAFAVGYLRADVTQGGLEFPETTDAVWADYFYLAVQVSTTFSSSDVTVSTTAMRKLVTLHTLIAFVFNTLIVALFVSALISFAG